MVAETEEAQGDYILAICVRNAAEAKPVAVIVADCFGKTCTLREGDKWVRWIGLWRETPELALNLLSKFVKTLPNRSDLYRHYFISSLWGFGVLGF